MLQPGKHLSNIVVINGPIASGKDYLANKMNVEIFNDSCEIIPISDFVKEVSNFDTREELSTTQDLDKEIIQAIYDFLDTTENGNFIFTGVRQLSILKAIEDYAKKFDVDYLLIDIEVDAHVRQQRFETRQRDIDTKSSKSFEDLSLQEMRNYDMFKIFTYVLNDGRCKVYTPKVGDQDSILIISKPDHGIGMDVFLQEFVDETNVYIDAMKQDNETK